MKNMRRFSKEQLGYIAAKALFTYIEEQYNQLTRPITESWKRGEITDDEWVDAMVKADLSLNYLPAMDLLREAEERLVEWGKNVLSTVLKPDEFEKIKIVWDYWWLPEFKDRIIEILMNLNAEEVESWMSSETS